MSTTPIRSKRYLDWVRSRPCCICGGTQDIHAHHHGRREGGGGMGIKTCDLHTVPLCQTCHGQWHQQGAIRARSRDATMALLWREVAIQLRAAAIAGLLEKVVALDPTEEPRT